jgi:segregation and condensation protein A
MSMSDLAVAYQEILVRARKRTHVLKKETVSIHDKIMEFAGLLSIGQLYELKHLLSEVPTRAEIVATFLAALELSRLKKMRLHQEEVYSMIYLQLLETLENFDTHLATGFDAINTVNASLGIATMQP